MKRQSKTAEEEEGGDKCYEESDYQKDVEPVFVR